MWRKIKDLSVVLGATLIMSIGVALMFNRTPLARAQPLSTTFTVANTGDSGAGSLRQAILDANATAGDDVINITAMGTLNLLSALPSIAETVTIQGPGMNLFAIDGQNLYRPFDLDNVAITISDLTIQRGSAGLFGTGGGIRSFGPLTLTNVSVMSNTAQLAGGGIEANDALALNGSQVLGNAAGFWAGGVYALGPVVMNGGLFQNNACVAANCDGGGAYVSNTLFLVDTTFISNTALRNGGGAYIADTTTLNGGLFQNNRCTADPCYGAGLYVNHALGLTGTVFLSNVAVSGAGAAWTNDGKLLNGGLFQDNRCINSDCVGGALFIAGTPILSGTYFVSNTAGYGGGLYGAEALLTLSGAQFINNTAKDTGGGIWVLGELILSDTQFISNTSVNGAGGGFVYFDAMLKGGLFQNDRCTGTSCDGGGLSVLGTLIATNTQFTGNTVNGQGGGLYVFGSTSLNDTQFVNNWSIGNGGGIFAGNNVALNGGLFQGNSCLDLTCFGGGLYTSGTLTLSGTHFLGNIASPPIALGTPAARSISRLEARPTAPTTGGAGAAANDAVTLTAGLFQDNHCFNGCFGGGLYAGKSLTLSGTHFISNVAITGGGGVLALGEAVLKGGFFQNNSCTGATCSGGGLLIRSFALTGTQFLNNSAARGGGLLLNGGSSTPATLVNALFARNTATLSGTALALFGNAHIYHVTIGGDTSISGTAIYAGFGDVNIFDTIIANHSIGIEASSSNVTVTQDYNLFYDDGLPWQGPITGGTHNATGLPHFVDVAADNYHLGAGSAAIDKGTNVGVLTDVDGDARPKGNGFDIGYDEFARWVIYLPLVEK